MIRVRPYLLTITFIVLLVSTYFNLGKFALIVLFCAGVCRFVESRKIVLRRGCSAKWYALFFAYCFATSIVGIALGNVEATKLIENICLYVGVPIYIYYFCLPDSEQSLKKSIKIFRSFVVLTAVYGLVEQVTKKNLLSQYIKNDAVNWLLAFEQSRNYQVSSVYLHYNYYGCILVGCYILLVYFPIKNKFLNRAAMVLVLEQLFACQSRMSWIAILVILFIQLFNSGRLTNKKARRIIRCSGLVLILLLLFPSILGKITGFIHARFLNIIANGMNDGSLGQRLGTLLNWNNYFNSRPLQAVFGSGYQSIGKVYLTKYSYFAGYSTADCLITIYLVEAGLVGTILLCLFLGSWLLKEKAKHNVSYYLIVLFLVEGLSLDLISNYYVFFFLTASFFLRTNITTIGSDNQN